MSRPVPLLTVFTPAYNRANELVRLYGSLLAQDDTRFEWLVVDDGSTDGTGELVRGWVEETTRFKIRYIRQENSGKHVAHNRGVLEAGCGLFMCVDSDDWLSPKGVSTVLSVQLRESDAGMIFPKLLFEGGVPQETPWFPEGTERIELSDMRMKYGLVIETAIVFRTKILSRHPFPAVEGERYMPEGSAYYDFRYPEVFVVNPSSFYCCEYLDSGLTKNIYRNWFDNPGGVVLSFERRYKAARRYFGLRSMRERLVAVAGIESLNIALKRPLRMGLTCGLVELLVALPIAVVLAKKRYTGLG